MWPHGSRPSLARVVPDLETVRQIGDVHHVSLGVYDELPIDVVVPELARFAEGLTSLSLRLANVGIFPGGVVFFGPVVTFPLSLSDCYANGRGGIKQSISTASCGESRGTPTGRGGPKLR